MGDGSFRCRCARVVVAVGSPALLLSGARTSNRFGVEPAFRMECADAALQRGGLFKTSSSSGSRDDGTMSMANRSDVVDTVREGDAFDGE